MSKIGKKLIHPSRNEYVDRQTDEMEKFPELTVRLERIESILLLLDSDEELVLTAILKHLTDYVLKNDANVAKLKENDVLELMLQKEFYRQSSSIIVRRFSLYLAAHIVESMNTLLDLETGKTFEIVQICLDYYMGEQDDFCLEYLSVIINKCLNDPQVVGKVLESSEYVEKFFSIIAVSNNPDVILNSLELLEKMLRVHCSEELQQFIGHIKFPLNRIMCELTSEFLEIRRASLKVLRILILDVGEACPLNRNSRRVYILGQLTKLFCENLMQLETGLVVEVLSAALRNESMTHLFFEQNLFERYVQHINNSSPPDFEDLCKSLMVLSEAAGCVEFLPRLVEAEVTEKLLNCLLVDDEIPSNHILMGLNRMMKHPDASNRFVEAYERGVVTKLLAIVINIDVHIKTREQSADLLQNLLKFAYHRTAGEMMDLRVSEVLAIVFGQDTHNQSTDLLLTLLNIVECLAANVDYREQICENNSMLKNLGILLMNSFSTAIVVTNIFRCLCSLVDEDSVRHVLLQCYISSSIKRALKSLSTLVKTSVTNFIMQTSRFPEFVCEYIDHGVLEVLITHQKHAFCVPTWGPAIESILSKTPTLKFCIRNHLSFTDITSGRDFFVSKKKFEDFRIFQAILKEDVSPLHPILVVNFERAITPENSIVRIPVENCRDAANPGEWCYCRTPGDPSLPQYLAEVNGKMEEYDLIVNPVHQKSSIDFENIAKRVKIIGQVVAQALGHDLTILDLNTIEECSQHTVDCHLKDLAKDLHCTFIPLGLIKSGCQFERAVLFKTLADQVGLPCTLQRSVDGRLLFNEVPLPVALDPDVHCDPRTLKFMPWRMLRPTHVVDLMYNVGELYPIQSRQALQYLRLY